jgi:hypothetical protein
VTQGLTAARRVMPSAKACSVRSEHRFSVRCYDDRDNEFVGPCPLGVPAQQRFLPRTSLRRSVVVTLARLSSGDPLRSCPAVRMP